MVVSLSKFGLKDKVAIVTGGGQGIGKAIALGFATVGAHVVIADISAKTGEATAAEVRALGRRSLAITTDVCDGKQIAKLVAATMAEFGRIDILVNNAGIVIPVSPIVAVREEDWDKIMTTDLKSVFLCSKAVARVMIDQNKGNIINIASMAALRAAPGTAVYGVAKAGVISLTASLAAELARYHIRVNTVAPGTVDTPQHTAVRGPAETDIGTRFGIPLDRVGQPDDIAAAVIYLASDASDYVSGEIIPVKGGPYTRKGDMEHFMEKFPSL